MQKLYEGKSCGETISEPISRQGYIEQREKLNIGDRVVHVGNNTPVPATVKYVKIGSDMSNGRFMVGIELVSRVNGNTRSVLPISLSLYTVKPRVWDCIRDNEFSQTNFLLSVHEKVV